MRLYLLFAAVNPTMLCVCALLCVPSQSDQVLIFTQLHTSHHCTDLLNVHTQTETHRDVDAVREVGDEGVVGGPGLAGDVAEYFLGTMEPFYTEI